MSAYSTQFFWKTGIFSSYTLLSLYEAKRVDLLAICRIPGCMGITYVTCDSVAYIVLVIKRPKYTLVNSPSLEWTERALLFSLSWIWCRAWYVGMPRILVKAGFGGDFLGTLPLRLRYWSGGIIIIYVYNSWIKVINNSLEINE